MVISYRCLGNYGRLGNQMFQYALLKSISEKTGFVPKIPKGNYDILNLNLDCEYLDDNFIPKTIYQEPYFHYCDDVFNNDDVDFEGYFQSYKYFYNIRQKLYQEFSFKKNIYKTSNSILNPLSKGKDFLVSIHVRRGDYLKYPTTHPTCSLSYYNECIDFFRKLGKCKFIIFSDDLFWCQSNLKGDDLFYHRTSNQFIDMCSMISCDHNIIANSSFSWWGAYLNQNPHKIVKYPKAWFGKDGPQDYFDLCPTEWQGVS